VSTVRVDVTISGNKVTPNGDRVQAHVGEPIQQQERPTEWARNSISSLS
jgi:hypothetical protein